MSRSLSVKIKKEKVMTALQARLDQNIKDEETNKQIDERYEQAVRDYHNLIVSKYLNDLTPSRVDTRWNRLEIQYELNGKELPKEPDRDNENRKRVLGNYEVEEIQNAIRMLEMADDEYVNASTMKSISQYL